MKKRTKIFSNSENPVNVILNLPDNMVETGYNVFRNGILLCDTENDYVEIQFDINFSTKILTVPIDNNSQYTTIDLLYEQQTAINKQESPIEILKKLQDLKIILSSENLSTFQISNKYVIMYDNYIVKYFELYKDQLIAYCEESSWEIKTRDSLKILASAPIFKL